MPSPLFDATAPSPPAGTFRELVGKVFLGRYRVDRQLESSRLRFTYRATDVASGRRVLLQRFPERKLAADAETAMHLLSLGATLTEASIAPALAVWGDETGAGGSICVFDSHGTETLGARLDRGRLSLLSALGIAVDLAGALNAGHGAGIAHGGVRCNQIWLYSAGERVSAQLAGFGFDALLLPGPGEPESGVFRKPKPHGGVEGSRAWPLDPSGTHDDVRALGLVLLELARNSARPAPRFPSDDTPSGRAARDERVLLERLAEHCLNPWPPNAVTVLRALKRLESAYQRRLDGPDTRPLVLPPAETQQVFVAATRPPAKRPKRALLPKVVIRGD